MIQAATAYEVLAPEYINNLYCRYQRSYQVPVVGYKNNPGTRTADLETFFLPTGTRYYHIKIYIFIFYTKR